MYQAFRGVLGFFFFNVTTTVMGEKQQWCWLWTFRARNGSGVSCCRRAPGMHRRISVVSTLWEPSSLDRPVNVKKKNEMLSGNFSESCAPHALASLHSPLLLFVFKYKL